MESQAFLSHFDSQTGQWMQAWPNGVASVSGRLDNYMYISLVLSLSFSYLFSQPGSK